eukprot:jgi/Tetstr1/441865/TSEL_030076.t1
MSAQGGPVAGGSVRGVSWAVPAPMLVDPSASLAAMRSPHPPSPADRNGDGSVASCSNRASMLGPSENSLAKSMSGDGVDGQVRTLRGRVSWRTELFQEVLGRMRKWTPFHAQQARHHDVAIEIVKGASAHELNEMILYIDCVRFWNYCHKPTFDLLRTRLVDLGIPARAALLRGLIKVKHTLQQWWCAWVRDLILETQGEDLTLLKNMVDSGGDYHNLNKLLFKDMRLLPQTVALRKTILKHIQREGLQTRQARRHHSFQARPRVKIVSDIDDTLWSSGGHYPAGVDTRLPKRVLYPGVLALFREMINDANSWQHNTRVDNLLHKCRTPCPRCDPVSSPDLRPLMHSTNITPSTTLSEPAECEPGPGSAPAGTARLSPSPSPRASSVPLFGPGATPLRRQASSPIIDHHGAAPAPDLQGGTAWCRVPGFFQRHPAQYTDTLETVRKKIAHSMMRPERSVGQVHVDFHEMDQNFNTDCSLLFLSARPGISRTRGMLERVVYSRFKELYRTNQLFTMPTLLPGSLMAGLKAISIQLRESFRSRRPMSLITSAWIPVGFQKMIALRNFAAIYPEYDYVFFGDNGQADAYVCDRLMWEPPLEHTTSVDLDLDPGAAPTLPLCRSSLTQSSILVAFIHQVHAHDDVVPLRSETFETRESCSICSRRMSKFETYIGAAVQAVDQGLLSLRGLHVVAQEASEDFYRLLGASLVRGAIDKWRRLKADNLRDALNRDILAANGLLPLDMQLPALMEVSEWRAALQPSTSTPRRMARRADSMHSPILVHEKQVSSVI